MSSGYEIGMSKQKFCLQDAQLIALHEAPLIALAQATTRYANGALQRREDDTVTKSWLRIKGDGVLPCSL